MDLPLNIRRRFLNVAMTVGIELLDILLIVPLSSVLYYYVIDLIIKEQFKRIVFCYNLRSVDVLRTVLTHKLIPSVEVFWDLLLGSQWDP